MESALKNEEERTRDQVRILHVPRGREGSWDYLNNFGLIVT